MLIIPKDVPAQNYVTGPLRHELTYSLRKKEIPKSKLFLM